MNREQTHPLADHRLGRLLWKLAIPAMVAMLAQALYNITDAVIVGQYINDRAIAAVSVVFPVQIVFLALGLLLGIGGASLVSRSLGAGRHETAERSVGAVFFGAVAVSLPLALAGYLFGDVVLDAIGTPVELLGMTREYLYWLLGANIFFTVAVAGNAQIRAQGYAQVAMWTMLISAIVNVGLDLLLVGALGMGVRGAALATGLAEIAAMVFIYAFLQSGRSRLRLHWKYIRFDRTILGEVFRVGMSAFMMQLAGSLVVVVINRTLRRYGTADQQAVFGMIHRLMMMVFMPVFGIAQGMQPIVGYNYGARRFQRVRQVFQLAARHASVGTVAGFIIIMVFAEPLIALFGIKPALQQEAVRALRIMSLLMWTVGFQIVGTTLFQAVGYALPSFILSVSRQLVFLIPLVIILPRYMGVDGVWWSIPGAEVASVFLHAGMIYWLLHRLKREEHSMEESENYSV